jgi:CheY-like chemotaxis protein
MGSKILLADDSITIQKVVNLTFADEGIEVISVSNGDQAERRLGEVDPDLVLADIFMPGKNGYELCESIKQTPQFRNIPVVLLVGAFEPFNEAEARRVNADAHLTKPFESRVLVETVKHLIDKSAKPKNVSTVTQVMGSEPAPDAAQNPRPFPMPAIDLSAMSTPYPPQESVFADRVPNANLADPTPFADSFPANFEFGNREPAAQPPQVELLDSVNIAFTSEVHNPQSAAPTEGAPANLADVFNIDMFAAPLQVDTPEPITNHSTELFDIPAAPVTGDILIADAVETRAEKTGEVVVDFENVNPPQELAPSAFDVVPPPAESVRQVSAEDAEARQFDTNELEPPSHHSAAEANEVVNAAFNGSANHQTPANRGFDFQMASPAEPATSSLLSDNEPLGDLLFNEFPQQSPHAQATEVAPLEFEDSGRTGGTLSGEPVPEEARANAAETQEFIQDTSRLTSEEATDVAITVPPAQEVVAFITPDAQVDGAGAAANLSQNSPAASDHAFELLYTETVDPIQVETRPSPSAPEVNFHLEQTQEPAETGLPDAAQVFNQDVLQPFEASQPGAPDSVAPEEKFTASDMWAAETQFTPVSIAPVPVNDYPTTPTPEAAETYVDQTASAGVPVYTDSPSLSAQPSPAAPPKDANHLEETPQRGVEMKQEMIDEIVRRVVAQLSDSVVREIAWEVVPDCVERVVSNLTKEDLAKRL